MTLPETTPCGPLPSQCDAESGEPCPDHEREQAHAEGEHAFCPPGCGQPALVDPGLRARMAAALRWIAVVGGCPPQMLVPVPDGSNPALARIADWQPLNRVINAVLAAMKPELERLADYENRITWGTTCGACAQVLDSGIQERERLDRAADANRLALSEALGLGTGAPWDAIEERAAELTAELTATVANLDVACEDGAAAEARPAPADGEPAELRTLPREVRLLVHAVDRMRGDWAEGDSERRAELWRGLHEASDAVWNRPLAVLPAPANRPAVLREGADAIDATFTGPGSDRYVRYGADLLRRLADEAQQVLGTVTAQPGSEDESCGRFVPDAPRAPGLCASCGDARGWHSLQAVDAQQPAPADRGTAAAIDETAATIQPDVAWGEPDARPGTTDHTLLLRNRPEHHAPAEGADCDGCGHAPHPADRCQGFTFNEQCECDAPVAEGAQR